MHLSHSVFSSTKLTWPSNCQFSHTLTWQTNIPFRDFLHKSSTQKRIRSFSSDTALLSFCNNAINSLIKRCLINFSRAILYSFPFIWWCLWNSMVKLSHSTVEFIPKSISKLLIHFIFLGNNASFTTYLNINFLVFLLHSPSIALVYRCQRKLYKIDGNERLYLSCHIHPPLTFPLSDKGQAMLFHFYIQFFYHPVNAVIQHQRARLWFDLLPADRALHFTFRPLIDTVGAEAVCTVQSDRLWNLMERYWSEHARTSMIKKKNTEVRKTLDECFL